MAQWPRSTLCIQGGDGVSFMCDNLMKPGRLWTRAEVLSRPSPVPKSPGVYAWYFRALDCVPSSACLSCGEFRLLYIGIPHRPRQRMANSQVARAFTTGFATTCRETLKDPRSVFHWDAYWRNNWQSSCAGLGAATESPSQPESNGCQTGWPKTPEWFGWSAINLGESKRN